MEKFCANHDESIAKLREDAAANEREHESFRRRLHEHDEKIAEMSGLMLAIQRQGDAIESMTNTLKGLKTSVDNVEKRVADIEKEPGEKWKKVAFEVVKYVVLAAVGVAVGYVVKGV